MNEGIDRRGFLATAAMGAAATATLLAETVSAAADEARDQADTLLREPQQGDPQLTGETLIYNPVAIQRLVLAGRRAAFESRIESIRTDLVAAAATHVGESRTGTRDQIEKYLALFDLPFEAGGNVIPFCAAGLSYVTASLYAQRHHETISTATLRNYLGDIDHHHFYPSASVMDMKYTAMGKRRWLARGEAVGDLLPRPGWLVVYNWDGDGKSDHVGLVESLAGGMLNTIEFNTSSQNDSNGGHVSRRRRALNHTVEGFIRPELKRMV